VAKRHIVALGGGGFSDGGLPTGLDDFILSLARNRRPRICFLPTASGDSETYPIKFYRAFAQRDCRPSDLTLFRRTVTDLRSFLLAQDVIYVGGGNTANMLAIWRLHGVDAILRTAWEDGVVLAGTSAGAICWFEAAVTDSFGVPPTGLRDGLGLLPGSACPHYNSEDQRRPVYHDLVLGGFPGGYAADDGVGLHFVDRDLAEVVSEVEARSAYEVRLESGRVVERPIKPRSLS
jgi:dipeptidase E